MDLPRACPVCATPFPAAGGAAFALHVADCTAPSSSSSPTVSTITRACAVCHHVYADGTAAHVVDFHEYECARANKRKAKSSSKKQQQGKRPRESPSSSPAPSAGDAEPVFPPYCVLCGAGGRALLQCGGACARAFHAACLDEVQAGNSRAAAPAVTGLASAAWRCAECARGVHACAACGFLGHESSALVKCAVGACGFFFHCACAAAGDVDAFVCPRHTCDVCGAVEPTMRASVSCSQCFAGAHVRCSSSSAGEKETAAKSLGLRSADAHVRLCDAHAGGHKPRAEETLALKYRVQQGDLVLLLEFANALLPAGAKSAAPDAFNQWGVVARAENVDGREQLLAVSVFSDGSVISVPNKYVLPLGTANAFATPQAMLRDCIKWHAVAELNLRHAALDALLAAAADGDTDGDSAATKKLEEARDHILNASCSAFYARAEKLSLTISQLFAAAKEGYTFWTTHRAELKQFEGSGAPIYVYLDTRAPPKSAHGSKADGVESRKPAAGDGDVDMEDAAGGDAGEGGSAANGSSSSLASSSSGGRSFLRAGTSVTRRPMQQGEAVEASGADRIQADATAVAGEDAASTSVAVAAALSDLVASVEQRSESSGAGEELMDVDDGPAAGVVAKTSSLEEVAAATSNSLEDTAAGVKLATAAELSTIQATIVDAVEVTVVARAVGESSAAPTEASAKVAFAGEKEPERDAKRQKLAHVDILLPSKPLASPASVPVAVVKVPSLSPASFLAANTFAREKPATQVPPPQARTRKERVLSGYSPQLLQELARQAAVFLDEEANPKRSRKSAHPTRTSAFPVASVPGTFRPPYFRPSVVFNRGPGRRLDGLSRLLLCQDKRNIKCFIQGSDENRCLHAPSASADGRRVARSEGAFVTVDLMSVASFGALEAVIRTRMMAAVEQDERYLKEIFGADAARARRLLREKRTAGLAVEIYYCSYDGSRSKVERESDDWLCFCANVCHLTAVVPLDAHPAQQ